MPKKPKQKPETQPKTKPKPFHTKSPKTWTRR